MTSPPPAPVSAAAAAEKQCVDCGKNVARVWHSRDREQNRRCKRCHRVWRGLQPAKASIKTRHVPHDVALVVAALVVVGIVTVLLRVYAEP